MIRSILMLDEIRFFRVSNDRFKNILLSPKSIKIHYSVVGSSSADCHIEEDPAVESGSELLTSVTDANRFQDPQHINFVCPSNPCAVRTAYSSMLDRELILRKLFRYCSTPVETKQKYLLLSVRNGEYIKDIRRAIARSSKVGENDKMMEVNDAVPCILHLEL